MNIRVFLLVLTLVGCGQVSMGQIKFEKGVKAGFNYTNLDLSLAGRLGQGVINGYHWNPSFHAGVYGLLRLPKRHPLHSLALQPELLFSYQGQKFTTPYNSDLRTSLFFVNIPVVVKYYIAGGLNLQIGPQLGILAGSKADLLLINNGNIQGLPLTNQNANSYLNKLDMSLVFGAGLDLPFGGSLTVRYNLGLSNVNKYVNAASPPTNNNGLTSTPSISTTYAANQVFQVSVGYRLKKKEK